MAVLPWYERDAAGRWTGREWASEAEARASVASGCTVHVETSSLVGLVSWAPSRWWRYVKRSTRAWKPRGFGGTD